MTMLIVEDDDAIATGLALNLKLAGHGTKIARDGEEALKLASVHDYDLILLDINLPKQNGLEVLSALRSADNLVPVIVVSARDGEFDKVAALRLGADDYVTKPFALAELLARIDAVLRRVAMPPPKPPVAPVDAKFDFGWISIDCATRLCMFDAAEVTLTKLEFQLLAFFAQNPQQLFTRAQLYHTVWGQAAGSLRTVDNFMSQLRKRFEEDPDAPKHFVTVRGLGFRFDP
jgi:two-component system alkaline phosphatase synthesis response regulator PhoP